MADSTPPAAAPPPRSSHHGRRVLWSILATILLAPALIFAAWSAITLSYTYSEGERAGYIQKFSRKGWLCKTWEGEIAMVSIPGTQPEKFEFSVRNDSIASEVERHIADRVALSYKQHRGVPSSCFGETQYYVTGVRVVGDPNTGTAPGAINPGVTPPGVAPPVATPTPAAPRP